MRRIGDRWASRYPFLPFMTSVLPLPELFPVPVPYTGAASAYNLGGILGASFAPSLAQVLEASGSVAWVGYYIAVAGLISFLAVLSMRETRDAPA
jgi:hypothetical protein